MSYGAASSTNYETVIGRVLGFAVSSAPVKFGVSRYHHLFLFTFQFSQSLHILCSDCCLHYAISSKSYVLSNNFRMTLNEFGGKVVGYPIALALHRNTT